MKKLPKKFVYKSDPLSAPPNGGGVMRVHGGRGMGGVWVAPPMPHCPIQRLVPRRSF
jgi:hypothetical protein